MSDDVNATLDDAYLFYSVIYSSITVVFGMAVLAKFLMNEFRFGIRSVVSLAILLIGEPVCHFLLKGPSGVLVFGLGCLSVYSVLPASHLPAAGKTVLITGCDSGFGHALAVKLHSIGMSVYAACLNQNGIGATELKHVDPERMHVVQMDVTKQDEIDEVFQIVSDDVGDKGLWGLVNNAGIFYLADLDMTSQSILEKTFRVNFFGMVATSKAFLPLIKRGKGRIINMSSFTGRIPMEHGGAYVASKYAVEGYSDVLRLEMSKFGVHVCLIEPAAFKTNLQNDIILHKKNEIWDECPLSTQLSYGREYLEKQYQNYETVMASCSSDLTPVVRAYRSALLSKRPRERYPCGRFAETAYTIFPFLPVWLSDRFCRSLDQIGRDLIPNCLKLS